MNRTFFPFVLIILAIGLFIFYTNGAYQATKGLSAELSQYDTALAQSQQVLQLRDQLLAQRNNLPSDGVDRLKLLLPDNVDNIRLIIDINDIAARYHMQVEGISVGGQTGASSATQSANAQAPGANQAVGQAASPIGSVTLGFTVNASYNNFLAFLHDLERSLRLVDASSISFHAEGKNTDTYSMVITTYWLK